MKLSIIGSGYVGLVSGACLAELGHTVVCADKDADKIALLNAGGVPIYELGLEALIKKNVGAGRLSFVTDGRDAVAAADAVFITVDTPPQEDMSPDLSSVLSVIDAIAPCLRGETVVVVKSTVPLGTCARLKDRLSGKASGADFSVVSNPEFLREGKAVEDFMSPDRIVIGADDDRAKAVMRKIYRPFIEAGQTVFYTDTGNSELIKYVSNAMLAMKVAFINEVADLCEAMGLDVEEVSRAVGLDARIGSQFLSAGPGYGGSCFPKDTHSLLSVADAVGAPMSILRSVIAANDERKKRLAEKIARVVAGGLSGKVIAVLGLAFKADTDDMRCAPSLDLVPALLEQGAAVRVYDPQAMANASLLFPQAEYCDDVYAAAAGADLSVFQTDWQEFLRLDWHKLKTAMNHPAIYDLRNFLDGEKVAGAGFQYFSIGRSPK